MNICIQITEFDKIKRIKLSITYAKRNLSNSDAFIGCVNLERR